MAGWRSPPGQAFATVGISQLTTSRRLGAQALDGDARSGPGRFRLARRHALGDRRRACRRLRHRRPAGRRPATPHRPARRPPGTDRPAPFELAALQASCTAEVVLEGVQVDESRPPGRPDARAVGPARAPWGPPGWRPRPWPWARPARRSPRWSALASRADRPVRAGRRPLRDLAADWSSLMACAPGGPDAFPPPRCVPRPTPWSLRPPRPT